MAAPWRRAPLLLLRGNSAVLAALLFAGPILGAANAATPPVREWPAGRQLLARRDATVRNAGARAPHLGEPVLTMSGPPVQLTRLMGDSAGPTGGGRLLYRDAFLEHIRRLDTAPGFTGCGCLHPIDGELGERAW
jgi:hypothetical protein